MKSVLSVYGRRLVDDMDECACMWETITFAAHVPISQVMICRYVLSAADVSKHKGEESHVCTGGESIYVDLSCPHSKDMSHPE